jgi:DNA-3-methyladenine glycosylase
MLPINFFNRSSVAVAKDLIGKVLCRKFKNSKITKLKITETEAYEGFSDLASHASRGLTKRNAPMFEGPGTIYIYFTYGMHWMLNIVCGPKGHPSAVLIRGITSLSTSPLIPLLAKEREIQLNGPAKLTKYLGIDKSLNGKKLGKKNGLWIESPTLKESRKRIKIIKMPRVGIAYAGPIWSRKKWRFVLTDESVGGQRR